MQEDFMKMLPQCQVKYSLKYKNESELLLLLLGTKETEFDAENDNNQINLYFHPCPERRGETETTGILRKVCSFLETK